MNYKKKNVVFFSVILVLCLLISVIIYTYIGGGSKEVKAAKQFVRVINHNDLVENIDVDNFSFKSIAKSDLAGDKDFYSLEDENFRIDVDGDYNVIGFSNNISKVGEVLISEDKAIELGEKYLKYIYEGDIKFKEFMKENSEIKSPYYTLIFTKIEDGYPFYSDEVMIGIDKTNGKMDSYANSTSQRNPKRVKIKKNQEQANEIAKEAFAKINSEPEIIEDNFKAFCDNKESRETELCYIVTVKGKDLEGNEIKIKYFVSTETGKIINFEKDKITETISN